MTVAHMLLQKVSMQGVARPLLTGLPHAVTPVRESKTKEGNIMTMTGLTAFDTTLQETNQWLNEISEELRYPQRQDAYSALRATIQALRDRLTIDEAVHLGDQLPLLVRGIYYEGWDCSANPTGERTQDEFLGRVQQNLRYDIRMDAERIVRAVFHVLAHRISPGEVEQVVHMMPKEIQQLFR